MSAGDDHFIRPDNDQLGYTDFRWLIEAPGQNYLAVQKLVNCYSFHWTKDHNAALAFRAEHQADYLMMAVRTLDPQTFAFETTLGVARAVEHGWVTPPPRSVPEKDDGR